MTLRRILRKKEVKFFVFAGVSLLAVWFPMYYLNLKPIWEAQWGAESLKINYYRGSAGEIKDAFERALSFHTFGDSDVRERLALVAQNIANRANFSPEERIDFIEFAARELRKETAGSAKDVKYLWHLAKVFKNSYTPERQYLKEAEAFLQEAIRISPSKQSLYFDLTEVYLYDKEYGAALNIAKKALAIDPSNINALLNFILAARAAGRSELVNDLEAKIKIDLHTVYEDTLERVGFIYRGQKDFESARAVYEALTLRYPNAKYYAVLAAVLAELGEFDLAIENAREAALRSPDFRQEADIFIKRLEAKRAELEKRPQEPRRSNDSI